MAVSTSAWEGGMVSLAIIFDGSGSTDSSGSFSVVINPQLISDWLSVRVTLVTHLVHSTQFSLS